jgi:hypothetical protein
MYSITTVKLRNSLKEVLKKVDGGELVVVKYHKQEYVLTPKFTFLNSKLKKPQISSKIKSLFEKLEGVERQNFVKKAKQQIPEIYNLSPQAQKDYLYKEKSSKYGL